jgi:2,4-dienoyl-CoA reductase-like NADH-dependent reductase (Old Yellow Enzyme family)
MNAMNVFEKAKIGTCTLENRIIRSATYEGRCDAEGFPGKDYVSFYDLLSRGGMGAIITGFAYISREGRAMQPRQAAMDSREKVPAFRAMTDRVHANGGNVFMQLAHAGRQTLRSVTGLPVVGCSGRKSLYFRGKPRSLGKEGIGRVVSQFGESAAMAREAGFDGVQVHAAHGYLLHQFILPSVNNRKDRYGPDKLERIGREFLERVIGNIRQQCGADYPLLIKVSGGDDLLHRFTRHQFINLIRLLDRLPVDAIEVSYGTMDFALSIFRGDFPGDLILRHNPFFKDKGRLQKKLVNAFFFPYIRSRTKPYRHMYNLEYAKAAREHTSHPVITVGGFRSGAEIRKAVGEDGIDFVSLSRPFLAEPDFVRKLEADENHTSSCCNCNYCAILCDTPFETKCHKN